MFRPASRLIARSAATRAFPRAPAAASRRFISTAPPTQKSRSWKSLVARVGIAGAIIYYYNTTDVFAEEPRHAVHALPETDNETEVAELPTIDSLAQERQLRKSQAAQAVHTAQAKTVGVADPQGPHEPQNPQAAPAGDVQGLEEEADQQGAFNPETGEINWDCPCLGGMAHGPCGEQFKAAFSCFVFSTEEPKGVDCIEKFKDMQNCFREYPEHYGAELEGDEEDDVTADRDQPALADGASQTTGSTPTSSDPTGLSSPQAQAHTEKVGAAAPKQPGSQSPDAHARQDRAKAAAEQVEQDFGDNEKVKSGPAESSHESKKQGEKTSDTKRAEAATNKQHKERSESEDLVPRAWHSATEDNDKVQKSEK